MRIRDWEIPTGRVIGAGALSAISIVVIAAVLRALVPMAHSENGQPSPVAQNTMGTVNNNQGIVTEGQTGNNSLTITQTPNPKLQLLSDAWSENPDGTYTYKALTQVIAQFAPGHMILQIQADGLKHVGVIPDDGIGAIALFNEAWNDRQWQATINGPSGRYFVVVTTKTKTPVQIGVRF